MKIIIMLLTLLIPLSCLAGTWVQDFENDILDEWSKNNNLKIDNGSMSFYSKLGATAIWMKPSNWKNYSLEASILLAEKLSVGDMEMSLCIYSQAQTMSCYGFCLQFIGGKYASDEAQINNILNFVNVTHMVRKKYDIEENTWYRLKGVIDAKHLSFYINQELILETDVANLLPESGTVGIYVSGVRMLFDDLVIIGDDIPNVGLPVTNIEHDNKLATSWGHIRKISKRGCLICMKRDN